MAGIIGSVFTTPAIGTWYTTLNKPSFQPPNWLFGPVWITLYTLMGIGLYIIWQSKAGRKEVKFAITLFVVHLFINAAWSIIFFGFHNIGLAFITILVLWAMIIWIMFKFGEIKYLAVYLLAPYLGWVTYAAVLNYAILQLN